MSEEQAVPWRKSSHSQSGACVELAVFPDGTIGVRDSKNPGLRLSLSTHAWTTFLTGARGGHFDL